MFTSRGPDQDLLRRMDAVLGSRRLHDATMRMFQRGAIKARNILPDMNLEERTRAVAVFMHGTVDADHVA